MPRQRSVGHAPRNPADFAALGADLANGVPVIALRPSD